MKASGLIFSDLGKAFPKWWKTMTFTSRSSTRLQGREEEMLLGACSCSPKVWICFGRAQSSGPLLGWVSVVQCPGDPAWPCSSSLDKVDQALPLPSTSVPGRVVVSFQEGLVLLAQEATGKTPWLQWEKPH